MRSLIPIALLVCGCAPGIYRAPKREPNFYSINADGSRSEKYSRINQWSTFGVGGLGAQTKIADAYEKAQHAPAPEIKVDVFNASLPAGVTLEHGLVKIEQDAPYEAVGRFEIGYWKSSAPRETEIEEDLRRLASVADANTVVVEVHRFDHADTRVNYVAGIVLRKRAVAARTTTKRVHTQLAYSASGPGCPTRDEFADEVSAKLGYSPWRDGAPMTLRAEISQKAGKYHATVSVAGSAVKELVGGTCPALIDALVTVVVIQLDPEVAPRRFD